MARYILYFMIIFLPSVILSDIYDTVTKDFFSANKALVLDGYEGQVRLIRDISKPQACALTEWNKNQEAACRCCIVQESNTITKGEVDGSAILKKCFDSGLCSDASITTLKQSENLSSDSDTQCVKTLYDRSVIIKEVSILPEEVSRGKFSESGLKSFLVRAFSSGKLLDSAFSNPQELVVTNLATEWKALSHAGGMATRQLFLVKNIRTKQEYIIKDLGKGKGEALDVAFAARYKPLKKYTAPEHVNGFPILSLPIACLEYNSWGNHLITITPRATGKEFFSYIIDYLQSPSDTNKTRLQNAYVVLGETLARFHKQFMKNKNGNFDSSSLLGVTLVHGDLHAKNVFFDEALNRIYWIDLERLGKSIFRPVTPAIDFGYILLFPFFDFPWKFIFEMNIKRKNLDIPAWFIDFYTPFINTYLNAFGGNKVVHAEEMKELLHIKNEGEWYNRGKFLLPYLDSILDDIIANSQ